MKVLFWNTHKNNNINSVLLDVIVENEISMVVLAEYTANADQLIALLSDKGILMRRYMATGCDRITVLGSVLNVEPGPQSKYASMQVINKIDILCCVHLPSQIYSQGAGMRRVVIGRIISDINQLEAALNTENTIVVGDFNVNPFDEGCIDADMFHGIPTYSVASRKSRVVGDEEFKMFYNPMWNFLGDFKQPYGTHFYSGNQIGNVFWNIYDQVLIRPVLYDRFTKDQLKIITETQSHSFLTDKGYPNEDISDHFPIVFEIKEVCHGNEN
ncbi:MAG: endonuclease/exonuclease/phosphatase [Clostridia bacterium]|nr:endonuclease/exonuclease/phosphatase [Clostridia bacterium]